MISSNKRFLGAICRKAVTLIQRHKAASRKKFAWRTLSTSTSVTTDIEAQGLLDSKGLTVFDTLHQLQETSCEVFSNNDLFGTFNDKSGKFEYMTYEDFGQKVSECRAVLKHLGEFKNLFSLRNAQLNEILTFHHLTNLL